MPDEGGDGVRGGVSGGDGGVGDPRRGGDGVWDGRRVKVCPIMVRPELPTIDGGLPGGGVERRWERRLW